MKLSLAQLKANLKASPEALFPTLLQMEWSSSALS